MTDRTLARVAWVVLGFVGCLYSLAAMLSVLNGSADVLTFLFSSFAVVGALVASRQPRNPIGWILLAIGLVWGLYSFRTAYSIYGLTTNPGALPRPDLVLGLTSWVWVPAVGLMGTFLILLFPGGDLPSRRWKPWAWFSATALIYGSVVSLIGPSSFTNDGFPNVKNPFAVEGLVPVRDAVYLLEIALILLSRAGCVGSLIQRFRRSHGHERLQLKWLAAGTSFTAVAYLGFMASAVLHHYSAGPRDPLWFRVVQQVGAASFLLIPLAIGIAILRHRLYQIDVIINKALLYGVLTAVLAGIYGLIVTLAGTLFSGSSVTTAAATCWSPRCFSP